MPLRLRLVAALALAFAPAAASAHPELVASSPADGDALSDSPVVIRLLFDEPVEPGLTMIRLLGAGRELVLELRVDPADPHAILGIVPGALESGPYQVAWQVTAADGHRIQGGFQFEVAPAAAPESTDTPPRELPPAAPMAPPPEIEPASRGPASLPLGVLRGAAVFALMAFAGAAALGAGRRTILGLAVAATALLAVHALGWAAYASPRGLGAGGLRALLGTLPGRLEAARLVLCGLALAALAIPRGRKAAAVLALAAVAATAGIGHAAARTPWWSVPAKGVHLLAAAVWVGGLVHLAAGALRSGTPLDEARRVSSLALAAVFAVGASGAIQAFLNLSAPMDVVRSPYGILVLIKTIGLAVLVLFGARHRFRLMPGMTTGGALERSVRWEIGVMALVALAAGLLAYTPLPSD